MTVTTIEVTITVGPQTQTLQLVGDPGDAMFAVQVGRAVGQMLMTSWGGV